MRRLLKTFERRKIDVTARPEKTHEVSIVRRRMVEISEETRETDELAAYDEILEQAKRFLLKHPWCSGIAESRIGIFVPGVVSVFLFRIEKTEEVEDDWLWVVVGDVPPGYLVTDHAPNPAWALHGYIELCKQWTEAVKKGESVEGLYPVNVPPTVEWAEQLDSRLKFLEEEILERYRADLV
ncbi:hypothetical protein [Hwanghaeella sp.]|uniref:hypothetical protein n=1 Tax=Hwanghaeella sp. TaxID=2605943 RepID=UPI003CCBCEF5